tara:strand:+ start:300 stop:728 length:429 start_codon:yes stop_codon:yes gene_type:complete
MSWQDILRKMEILPQHQMAMNESKYGGQELIFHMGRTVDLLTDGTFLTLDDWVKNYKKYTPKDIIMLIDEYNGKYGLKYIQDNDNGTFGQGRLTDTWAFFTEKPFTYYFYPQNKMFYKGEEITKEKYFELLGIDDKMQEKLQ